MHNKGSFDQSYNVWSKPLFFPLSYFQDVNIISSWIFSVKSKLYKTNQDPQLVLINYKLILFIRRIFQTQEADEPYHLIVQFDVPKTVCANYVLSWLFTDSNHQTQTEQWKEAKMRHLLQRSRTSTSTKDLHQKARSPTVSENKRTFSTLSLHKYQWMSSNVQAALCKSG